MQHPGMQTVRRTSQQQKLTADLCVVGSGAAGLSAALEARALGQSVVIVDAAPQIGGQAVNSAIGTICGLYANGPAPGHVTHGVMDPLLAEMTANGQATARRARNTLIVDYAINGWMRWVERQILETDVMPVTGAVLRGVERQDRRISALPLRSRTKEADRVVERSTPHQQSTIAPRSPFMDTLSVFPVLDMFGCSSTPQNTKNFLFSETKSCVLYKKGKN